MRLYFWMIESPAWGSLDPIERSVYLAIAHRYTGKNNGAIGCSIRDLSDELHIGKSSADRALKTLAERGFIVRSSRGFLGKTKHASQFELTEHANDLTGALASKTFMKWRPEI